MTLHVQLPIDILIYLFVFLDVGDILSLRKTCTTLNEATHLIAVWHNILRQLESKNIPIPLHDADEPEKAVRKALLLHRNWRSENPQITRSTQIRVDDSGNMSYIKAPHFLPGRSGRYLCIQNLLPIAVDSADRDAMFWTISVWRHDEKGTTRVAEMTKASIGEVAFNEDPSNRATLAIVQGKQRYLSLYNLNFNSDAPSSAFTHLCDLPETHTPLHLNGNTLICQDNANLIHVYHLVYDETSVVLSHLGSFVDPLIPEQSPTLAIYLTPTHFLVFRRRTIEIYPLPRPFPPSAPLPATTPIQTHRFPWSINTLCIEPTHDSCGKYPTLNLLIRFDSPYPWPLNTLHHFILAPVVVGNAENEIAPYPSAPRSIQHWPSHIALFAPSSLALGVRGTALWLDSNGEEDAGGMPGQRIAMRRLAWPEDPQAHEEPEKLASLDLATRFGQVNSEAPNGCLSVLGTSDDVDWEHVTLVEEEGVVMIAYATGLVEVRDYAPLQ